jgi:hypothetical protein
LNGRQIYNPEPVEEKTQDDGRADHPRRHDEHHDQNAGHDQKDLDGFDCGSRQQLVHGSHVFRKPVQNSTGGVGVEESHGGLQDVGEHAVVEPFGSVHADFEEQEGPGSRQNDGQEDEDGVDPDVGGLGESGVGFGQIRRDQRERGVRGVREVVGVKSGRLFGCHHLAVRHVRHPSVVIINTVTDLTRVGQRLFHVCPESMTCDDGSRKRNGRTSRSTRGPQRCNWLARRAARLARTRRARCCRLPCSTPSK